MERRLQRFENRILLENYFLASDLEAHIAAFVGHYRPPALPREPEQRHTCRRLHRPRPHSPAGTPESKKENHEAKAFAAR